MTTCLVSFMYYMRNFTVIISEIYRAKVQEEWDGKLRLYLAYPLETELKVMQTFIKYPYPGIFSQIFREFPRWEKIVKIRKRENTNNIAAMILSSQTRLTLRESQILPGGSHKSLQSQSKSLMQNEPCLKLFWPQHSGHELLLHFSF